MIRKDAESIVMENPGSIRTGKSQMLKGGISDPRNKALMKMFNLIGIGERAGSGVPDIYSVWEQHGWKQYPLPLNNLDRLGGVCGHRTGMSAF